MKVRELIPKVEIALSDYKDGKIVYLRDGVVFQSALDSLGELLHLKKVKTFLY